MVIHLVFKAELLGYYFKLTISGHILSVYLAPVSQDNRLNAQINAKTRFSMEQLLRREHIPP